MPRTVRALQLGAEIDGRLTLPRTNREADRWDQTIRSGFHSSRARRTERLIDRRGPSAAARSGTRHRLATDRGHQGLTNNALEHTPAGGSVTLRCGTDAARPYIEVVDTGVGIPSSSASGFSRGSFRASNARGSGSGLGLAM